MTKCNAIGDAAVYVQFEDIIRRHLQTALSECAAIAPEISCADPCAVMEKLNKHFSWAYLQDNASDALYEFREALENRGLDYYTAHNKERKRRAAA